MNESPQVETITGRAAAERDSRTTGSILRAAFAKDSWWVPLALVAAVAAVYAQTRHFAFINYDDLEYLPNNPRMDGAINWPGVWWAFTTGYFANWLPLTWISHMLDVQFFGFRAGAHHLTNVAFHAANSVLLFGLMRVLTGTKWRSAFVAAIFAVHPQHVESVAWISERKDVLSTLFLFLTIGAYARYVRRPGVRKYFIVAVFFACGLMSKPMLVTAPFLLLLLDVWPFRRVSFLADPSEFSDREKPGQTPSALLVEKLPLIAMSAACAVATLKIQSKFGAVVGSEVFPLDHRIKNALLSYVAYAGSAVWPAKLALFYPQHYIPIWTAIACAAVLAAVTIASIAAIRSKPYLFVGWFWYIGLLLPVIGIIQAGDQARADRYMYVPMVGLLIMTAWGLGEWQLAWPHYRLALGTAAICATLLCVPVSIAQTSYWRDSITIWERSLAVSSENFLAHGNLGSALTNRARFDEAIVHLKEALRLNPNFALAHASLAIALSKTGHEEEAIRHFEETRRLRPDMLDYYVWMALILQKKGRHDEAINYLKVAVKLKPESAETHDSLGYALASANRMDEAIEQFREAIRIRPHLAEAHNSLGAALASQGKFREAVPHFREAARIKPSELDWRVNLARALNDSGDHAAARRELAEVLRLDPNHQSGRQTLSEMTVSSTR